MKPTSSRSPILLSLGFLLACAPCRAAVRWDSTLVERTAALGEDSIGLSFSFVNPEPRAVTIARINPSCGCTTATLEKTTYGQGERGVLAVLFDAKGLTAGQHEKTIQVSLENDPRPTTLTMRVTIPAWIEASPRLVWWTIGEAAKRKETTLALHQGGKIRIASVAVDNPAMQIELIAEDEPGRYRLVAQPNSTATAFQATITLALELAGASPRTYTIFAQVR